MSYQHDPVHWRNRARALQQTAKETKDDTAKAFMLKLADEHERRAVLAETGASLANIVTAAAGRQLTRSKPEKTPQSINLPIPDLPIPDRVLSDEPARTATVIYSNKYRR